MQDPDAFRRLDRAPKVTDVLDPVAKGKLGMKEVKKMTPKISFSEGFQ